MGKIQGRGRAWHVRRTEAAQSSRRTWGLEGPVGLGSKVEESSAGLVHWPMLTPSRPYCWLVLMLYWCGPWLAGSVYCGCDQQIHMDYRSPVEKRDGTATLSHSLSERDGRDPCLDRLLLLFWAHYLEDGPYLLCTGPLWVVTFYRKQRIGCC